MLLQNFVSIAQAWHKVYVEKLSTEELEKEVERLKALNSNTPKE